jgi:hypothetical protein
MNPFRVMVMKVISPNGFVLCPTRPATPVSRSSRRGFAFVECGSYARSVAIAENHGDFRSLSVCSVIPYGA